MLVGLGGILTSSVGFDMKKVPWEPGNGFERFMSGAVGFPLSIILATMTGNGAWTADMALVYRWVLNDINKTNLKSMIRFSTISLVIGLLGTVLIAGLATMAALPACKPTIAIAEHKLAMTFLQTFARGIGGGYNRGG